MAVLVNAKKVKLLSPHCVTTISWFLSSNLSALIGIIIEAYLINE